MRPVIEIAVNIIFWAATSWMIISGFSIQSQEIEIVNNNELVRTIRNEALIIKLILAQSVSLLMFYANYTVLLRWQGKKKGLIIIASTLILIVAFALYYILDIVLLPQLRLPIPQAILTGILLFYFALSIGYAMSKLWLQSTVTQKVLLLEKEKAELKFLRSQLQPHFLFNALNNLLSMVDQNKNPQLAHSIDKLSGLLRFVIDGSKEKSVSLDRELEFLQNYISLQKLRFEESELSLEFTVTGNCSTQEIETGLFIPFIENAFKYGTEPERKSRISILFDCSNKNKISFRIENDTFEKLHQKSTGTGIASVRDRLNIVYPERHSLEIQENSRYIVKLSIFKDEGDNH